HVHRRTRQSEMCCRTDGRPEPARGHLGVRAPGARRSRDLRVRVDPEDDRVQVRVAAADAPRRVRAQHRALVRLGVQAAAHPTGHPDRAHGVGHAVLEPAAVAGGQGGGPRGLGRRPPQAARHDRASHDRVPGAARLPLQAGHARDPLPRAGQGAGRAGWRPVSRRTVAALVAAGALIAAATADAGVVRGTAGGDTLDGTANADRIYAGPGNDVVHGRAGNDRILGGRGDDRLFGGPGTDFIFGGPGKDDIFGGPGGDTVHGDGGNDTIHGDTGADVVSGGAGHDTIYGGPGDDPLRRGAGTDGHYGGRGEG